MSSQALDFRSFSRLFKALADETRLRIVALLAHGELCVCHLEEALRLSQPKVSRHLATLRSAGVVEHRGTGPGSTTVSSASRSVAATLN